MHLPLMVGFQNFRRGIHVVTETVSYDQMSACSSSGKEKNTTDIRASGGGKGRGRTHHHNHPHDGDATDDHDDKFHILPEDAHEERKDREFGKCQVQTVAYVSRDDSLQDYDRRLGVGHDNDGDALSETIVKPWETSVSSRARWRGMPVHIQTIHRPNMIQLKT